MTVLMTTTLLILPNAALAKVARLGADFLSFWVRGLLPFPFSRLPYRLMMLLTVVVLLMPPPLNR